MTPAEIDLRLQALLDARLDPLDDPMYCAHLAEHPEQLEAFALLRERLAVLPLLAPPVAEPTPPRWRWPVALGGLAAAVALAVVGTWAMLATPTMVATSHGRVLAASLQEIRPTLGAAAGARARTVLLDRADAKLEVFTVWSVQ